MGPGLSDRPSRARPWRRRPAGPRPVAVFHLAPLDSSSDPGWFAMDHRDPITGAPVMARGLVGSVGDTATVASPLGKERCLLHSGAPVSGSGPGLATFPIRVVDALVEVLEFNRRKHR